MSKLVETADKPIGAYKDTPAERFAQINASNALEGLAPTKRLLSIQKSIIAGELNIADAIKGLRAGYGLPDESEEATRKNTTGLRG